jgi:zinc/manganese transport system substrate-binding protein/manganese/iron transport system substrate-binding protein
VRQRATLIAAVAAVLGLGLAGCGSSDGSTGTSAGGQSSGSGSKLKVVATTTQVADFTRNIGGDRIELTQILKPNVDPHDYEASPADVAAIAKADVVVKSGVGLEKFLDPAISSAGFGGTVIDTSKGVTIREGNGTDEEKEGDPHIWHDPRNAKIMAHDIADGLAAKDPADKATYEQNYTAYAAKLDALDTKIQSQIDALPAGQRKLVTNHDAFGYYVARYGLQFVGSIIPSFDTSAELSAKDLTDLVTKIKATGVRAIFSESSLPPKTADTVGREAGVKVVEGGQALYGDTLGPAGSDGATYLQMEEHNTTTIVSALSG